jgi:very-short-patch-repair endonuclease
MEAQRRSAANPATVVGVCNTPAERERGAAQLASRQHGVVTRAQLLSLGFSRGAINTRIRSARLTPLHRGVYRLGPIAAPHAREMAAVMAYGPGAVLSHCSAAVLWMLLPRRKQTEEPEVTVIGRRPRGRPGIRLHLARALDPSEARTCVGIPVTSPARTLLDIATSVPAAELERAVAEAQARRLATPRELSSVLANNPGHRGAAPLRRVLNGPRRLTRSEAELRFLSLVRRADLPQPESNIRLGRHEVDFLWREERLVVEVDGFAFHSSRVDFEHDRRRDAELQASGFRVMRVTWRQITDEPEATLVRLAQALVAGFTSASPQARGE